VTVAGDVPARCASSVIESWSGSAGSSRSSAAIFAKAADIAGMPARIRPLVPNPSSVSEVRGALLVANENPCQC